MDWSETGTAAAVVAAFGACIAALTSFLAWRLQRVNFEENRQYKERLRLEERYFKLHLLYQELRIASVTLQSLSKPTAEYAPHLDALPIAQITESLATKDLLHADAGTKVRIARDDLVQVEQFAADARSPEFRRMAGFERKFMEQVLKTIASLDDARQGIMTQLPA